MGLLTIQLTLLRGDPEDLRSAGFMGRTTRVFACPWSQNANLMQLEEAKNVGIYILVGPPKDSNKPSQADHTIYIGECESLVSRFKGGHHQAEAADWSEILFATSLDQSFNKAHARRAEHLLVGLAKDAKRSQLLTSKTSYGTLSAGDAQFAEDFVKDVKILTQALGIGVFRSSYSIHMTSNIDENPPLLETNALDDSIFDYTYSRRDPIKAEFLLDGSDFVIKSGSYAKSEDGSSLPASSRRHREAARQSGILVPSDKLGLHQFASDFRAKSPSMACEMVYGSGCVGPDAWTNRATGKTYREWLAAKMEVKGG